MDTRVIGALSAAIAFGCTSSIPLEQLPAENASVFCDNLPNCLGRLTARANLAGSCLEAYEGLFANVTIPVWQAAIERGTMTYDGAAAATCVSEARALGCDIAIAPTPESCRDVTIGTLALGDPCSLSEECAGDAFCDGASCPDVPGTCTERRGNGSECFSDDECQAGLACEGGVCRAPASVSGGTCGGDTGLTCPLDEVCIVETDGEPGMCTPYSALLTRSLGEACDPSANELCSPELSCAVTAIGPDDRPELECVAIAASGGSCFAAIPDMCPRGEYCDAQPTTGTLEGTCQPLPEENEPCASSLGNERCADGLQCRGLGDQRLCVGPKDNGETCEVSAECHSNRCDGGVCAAPELCPM